MTNPGTSLPLTMTRRRFHFRLEPVRMLRKDAEQTVMRELAGELACAEQIRSELIALEARLGVVQQPPEGTMTARELSARQAYAERIERECTAAQVRLDRQQVNVEHAQRRLLEATQARQTLDRLEDRRRAVHETETRRVDAVEGNEISLLAHIRSDGVS